MSNRIGKALADVYLAQSESKFGVLANAVSNLQTVIKHDYNEWHAPRDIVSEVCAAAWALWMHEKHWTPWAKEVKNGLTNRLGKRAFRLYIAAMNYGSQPCPEGLDELVSEGMVYAKPRKGKR